MLTNALLELALAYSMRLTRSDGDVIPTNCFPKSKNVSKSCKWLLGRRCAIAAKLCRTRHAGTVLAD